MNFMSLESLYMTLGMFGGIFICLLFAWYGPETQCPLCKKRGALSIHNEKINHVSAGETDLYNDPIHSTIQTTTCRFCKFKEEKELHYNYYGKLID